MKKYYALLVGMVTVLCLLSGCIIHVEAVQTVGDSRYAREVDSIRDVLSRQAQAWNRGDIEAFMDGYWDSPQLSFSSGGRVTRGWTQTRDNYFRRYPNRDVMGYLAFDNLEITVMKPGVALVLGRWHLNREKPIGGVFSLFFRKIDRQWLIVHDHTSVDAKE